MDIDKTIGCWIKGLPYLWYSDGTLENSHRYYVPPTKTAVVFIDTDKFPIAKSPIPMQYMWVLRMIAEKALPQSVPIHFFYYKDCDHANNYFQVLNLYYAKHTEQTLQQLNVRIEGNPVTPSNIFDIAKEYLLPKHQIPLLQTYNIVQPDFQVQTISTRILVDPAMKINEYPSFLQQYARTFEADTALAIPTYRNYGDYLLTVLPTYPTLIGKYKYIGVEVFHSPYKDFLITLIKKRIFKLPEYKIAKILQEAGDDKYLLTHLRQYTQTTVQNWGEKMTDPNKISGRAMSRIQNFKPYLSTDMKKMLDIGAGNCEIAVGFGNYLKIPKEGLWVMDLDYYCADELQHRLSYLQVGVGKPINLEPESFDLILLLQTMHHMQDLDFKIKEAHKLLKPGGMLFVREHNCRNVYIRDLVDFEHLLYDVTLEGKSYESSCDGYVGTVYRSSEEWNKFLEERGFILLKEYPTIANKNPTMYYNAVYKKQITQAL